MATDLHSSYDALAGEYAKRFYDELAHRPLDRRLLDRLIDEVGDLGPICDLGCGPGQVASYLDGKGARAIGVDLSAGMIEVARGLNPDIDFRVGNLLALDEKDNRWEGVAAFYSIIHIPGDRVGDALTEIRRVLRPGGTLLLSFHIGEETINFDQLWGYDINMDFIFYPVEVIHDHLGATKFLLVDTVERETYPGVEYPGRRACIFARKSAEG